MHNGTVGAALLDVKFGDILCEGRSNSQKVGLLYGFAPATQGNSRVLLPKVSLDFGSYEGFYSFFGQKRGLLFRENSS